MNKKLSIVLSVLLLTLSASAAGVKYTLTGKAPADMEGKYMYLTSFSKQSRTPQDSAKVTNGAFTFAGEVATPDIAMLVGSKVMGKGGKAVMVALEPGNITVDFTAEKSEIKGGNLNKILNVYKDSMAVLAQQQKDDKFNEQMERYNDPKTTDEQRKEIAQLYKRFQNRHGAIVKEVIDQNLNNVVGAFLFANYKGTFSDVECDAILKKAGKEFLDYPMVQSVAEQVAVVKKRAAGNRYIDFEQPDAEGKMHKLSEYIGAGKYVLVDFWASWCGPCRAEMPNVKAAYDKYHSKGFEILSVSLDNKKDAWLKSIEQLGMTWHHLSDLQGWKNAAAQQYGINSIPCTMLIGPDGIIVGGDYRGEELSQKLAELLK